MGYIVIEVHGGAEYAAICTYGKGTNLVFEDYADAKKEADDCQDGLIIEL